MTDSLVDKLKASKLSDAPGPEDWKKQLKLPAKDTRHQTEVRLLAYLRETKLLNDCC